MHLYISDIESVNEGAEGVLKFHISNLKADESIQTVSYRLEVDSPSTFDIVAGSIKRRFARRPIGEFQITRSGIRLVEGPTEMSLDESGFIEFGYSEAGTFRIDQAHPRTLG